jgi:putative membrane protein
MKTDFSTPQRQELRGIVVIYFMTLFKRIRQNIFALIPLLSENIRQNYLHFVVLGFIALLIFQLVYSYKSYLNFTFYVKDGHFYLKQGIFKISDIDIPFDRIQNININQNLIQQMLNVVGVEIETAGKGDAEINIRALSKENAVALKNLLLAQKKLFAEEETPTESTSKDQKSSTVFKLDMGRLLKVGLSSNYLRGFGLVFAFTATLYQYVSDIVENFLGKSIEEDYVQLPNTLPYILGFIIFVIVVSFLVTIVSSVIKYFELKVYQLKQDFEVEYGLFKRTNKVIKKEKTQVFEVVENPISKLFKIKSLFVSQASSSELTQKNKIGLVGLGDNEIKVLFESLFDLPIQQRFVKSSSNFRYALRLIYRYLILVLGVALSISIFIDQAIGISVGTTLLLLFGFISYLQFKKSSIEINEDLIKINSGSIHTRYQYISVYKIQSVALGRNIFQQYNGYADLILYTASGNEKVQYISAIDAQKILNYLTYKAESSQLSWI